MKRNAIRLFLATAAAAFLFAARYTKRRPEPSVHTTQGAGAAHHPTVCIRLRRSPQLGHGTLQLKAEDVTTSDMSMGCFLVAHPKGNLIWDTGAVPDNSWTPTGHMTPEHITLADGSTRDADMDQIA